MHPFLGHIPLYLVMWLCAATVAVALGTGMAACVGLALHLFGRGISTATGTPRGE